MTGASGAGKLKSRQLPEFALGLAICLVTALPVSAGTTSSNPAPAGVKKITIGPGVALITGLKETAQVTTHLGTGHCLSGSTVYFFDNGRNVAVYDLDSQGLKDVSFIIGNRQIFLQPGEELVVSKDIDSTFVQLNPGLAISFRHPRRLQEAEGFLVFAAEFSIPSAVQHIKLLRAMLTSNRPSDRRTIRRILKNAAILQGTLPGSPGSIATTGGDKSAFNGNCAD